MSHGIRNDDYNTLRRRVVSCLVLKSARHDDKNPLNSSSNNHHLVFQSKKYIDMILQWEDENCSNSVVFTIPTTTKITKICIKMRTADRLPSIEIELMVAAWKSPNVLNFQNEWIVSKKKTTEKNSNWIILSWISAIKEQNKKKTIFIKFMRSVWCVCLVNVCVCIFVWKKKLHAEFCIDLCACVCIRARWKFQPNVPLVAVDRFYLVFFLHFFLVPPSKPLILFIIAFFISK